MGVRGLETFLERQCPTACYEVNIKEIIEKYKSEQKKDEILIVVDGSSCLRHFYGSLNWIFGGQLKEFTQNIQNFVDAFALLGARLVIYFDGATVLRKRAVWIDRRSCNVESVHEIFNIIQNGSGLSSVDNKRLFILPAGVGSIARYFLKYVCGCDVRNSVRECDEEIAEFAQTNQCFAILGQDTDYVIYEGAEYYLSMKNLDIDAMKTLCYDRRAFAKLLRIPTFHLPLFASLCGNDVIRKDDLMGFHKREYRSPSQAQYTRRKNQGYIPFHLVQKSVANYIRGKRFGCDLSRSLTSIAIDVFKDSSKSVLLETSLNSYSPQSESKGQVARSLGDSETNWMKILRLADSSGGGAHSLMIGNPFELCTVLEDFRLRDLPWAAPFLRPLRQRIYGVLMRERADWSGQVEEWCVDGTDSRDWQSYVKPVMPDEDLHPGLLALWDTNRDDVHHLRWELFAKSVSPDLNAQDLQRLPVHLVVPTTILVYMRRGIPQTAATADAPEYLADFEVEALAVQAVMLKVTDPSLLAVDLPYDVRAIRLATIFMRAVTHIGRLLESCGFPVPKKEAMPWNYFDGKVFHVTYKTLKAGAKTTRQLCVDQAKNSYFEEFELIRDIVLRS